MIRCVVTVMLIAAFSGLARAGDEKPENIKIGGKSLADYLHQAIAARVPANRKVALVEMADHAKRWGGFVIRNGVKVRVAVNDPNIPGLIDTDIPGRREMLDASFAAAKDEDASVQRAGLELLAANVRPKDTDREALADKVLAMLPAKLPGPRSPATRGESEVFASSRNQSQSIINCLAKIGTTKQLSALAKIAGDDQVNERLRENAATAIAKIGGKEAKSVLEQLAAKSHGADEFKSCVDELLDQLDGFEDPAARFRRESQ